MEGRVRIKHQIPAVLTETLYSISG